MGWFDDLVGQLRGRAEMIDACDAFAGHEVAAAGYGEITTEVAPLSEFYYAEDYHQQYLAKNPHGYCGLSGVSCPVGLGS